MAAVIQTINLSKSYLSGREQKTRVLNNVNISVEEGEFLGLIGPDGAGKTTLIKILCGMIWHDTGEASVLGFRLPSGSVEIKKHIGYLSQRFSLYLNLTIEENISYFARIFGVEQYRPRMERLLDAMDLARFRRRLARQLSGGMKQKLGVICGLIHSPIILFLDEPTTGVDPVSRREIYKVLEEMISEGLTVFLTTAYMDEAERADRIVMLNDGAVLNEGTYEDLKIDSGCGVFELIAGNPAETVKILKDSGIVRFFNPVGDRIHVITDARKNPDFLFSRLAAIGVATTKREPTLEDLFINSLYRRDTPA